MNLSKSEKSDMKLKAIQTAMKYDKDKIKYSFITLFNR